MLREHVRKPRVRARAEGGPVPAETAAGTARTPAAAPAAPAAPAARIGRLDGVGPDGSPWVTSPGWIEEPARALLAAEPPGGSLEPLVGRAVILVPLDSDDARVAILGWVAEPRPGTPVRRLEVNGERIVISATEELELRCGEARVTLTADGRVLVKGRGILNHAREVNRIRGGQVRIN
jgi:hypothetical protein